MEETFEERFGYHDALAMHVVVGHGVGFDGKEGAGADVERAVE